MAKPADVLQCGSDRVSGRHPQSQREDNQQSLLKGLELQGRGDVAAAAEIFSDILVSEPGNGPACYSLALIAFQRGDLKSAAGIVAEGLGHAQRFAPLVYLHGVLHHAEGRLTEALSCFDQALAINPDYADALINSGVLLRELLRHKEALERFNKVLETNPNNVTALANCAILLTEFKQSAAAIRMFERLLTLQPEYDYGLGLLCYERLHICDWTDFETLKQRILRGILAGKRTCKTLPLMAISDDSAAHFQAARTFAAHWNPPAAKPLWTGQRYNHRKIRVAYVSPDLREHPVGHLMAGVFESHDRNRFELYAYSLGVDDGSDARRRIVNAFDHFIDCRALSSAAVAQHIFANEIDVAIDLAGYTADSRMQIFAYKPAPVQVNYLGYPGTSGTSYMDYILADQVVIPQEHQSCYTERVVYLPDCYLPVATGIEIGNRSPTRAECGLPEQGIVFCSFSHDYKIAPDIFAIWMRLLREIPDSVLWLMARGDTAQVNLRQYALTAGVDASRLVFAQRVPKVEDHLARYRVADLFLDTHPYNAHTTAADALLAGLPVVTYLGASFPSRVAASLLRAAGMPEMITHSLPEYEAKIRTLAKDPEALADCRQRLAQQRANAALFDAGRFCRGLEATLIAMWRRTGLGAGRDELN